MNKKIIFSIIGVTSILIGIVLVTTYSFFKNFSLPSSFPALEKIYIALEGTGEIAVVDTQSRKIIKLISLSKKSNGEEVVYLPHNVQVAPNGGTVWVTANMMSGKEHQHSSRFKSVAKASEEHINIKSNDGDDVIVIDPATDRIIKRINLGKDLHLSYVTISSNDRYAIAVAQKAGKNLRLTLKRM